MKYRFIQHMIVSVLCALALLVMPLKAVAEGVLESQELPNPVIITEIQTGAATASDEFIELYNTSADPVDITGWQIRYANAGAAVDATVLLAEISSTGGASTTISGDSYFVLYAPSITVPGGVSGQTFTPNLSKNDKTIALFARDEAGCEMTVQDAVAWEATDGSTLGLGEGPAEPVVDSVPHILLQRIVDTAGNYIDTDNNAYDFSLAAGTPGADNPGPVQPGSEPSQGIPSPLQSFTATNCTIDPGEDPIPNEGLEPLIITELLPNPDNPLIEPDDEFIELYNPNEEAFQLEGYVLEVGTTTKTRYTFTADTVEPLTYRAFYGTETNLRLTNSSGQVRLFDPGDVLLAETDPYTGAPGNKTWAYIDDIWQWSATPSPNEENPIPEPEPDPPATPPNSGLAAPQLTELLPAPASGQLEFIELYNPNDAPFDLGGYVLEAGTTTKYRFTFEVGTFLQPKSFSAFFADQTNITLANKTSQARLLDPSGAIIAESLPYTDAKTNQAWIFQDGIWQWSTAPSPNAANILAAPLVASKKVASAASKKKASKPKTTKPKTTKEKDDKNDSTLLTTTKPQDPLHPGVLAGIALFAVLYGAYEYRNDVKSRILKWRANRAARAATGAGTKGP